MTFMDMEDSSSSTNDSPQTTSSPPNSHEGDSSPTATRQKKKITRTRTGCQTCRDRKVKCGEEKPHCLNCQRTNHVCPGYIPATVFKQRKSRRGSSSPEEDVAVVRAEPSRPPSSFTGLLPMSKDHFEDLRLLHYYQYDLAHTLSLPGAIGRTWSDGVPKLAFEGDHLYLVHALLASAAAHKVLKDPADIQSQRRGQEHYVQSLSLLQTLDLNSDESHASAALAAVMLLTWYEALNECWENGILHMRGAANIVREHNANLLKTPTGRQLIHLFARLELSASRLLLADTQLAANATSSGNYWDNVDLDLETLTIDDLSNGNSDFEIAWTEMMKIMVPVTVLRMVPRTGDRGTLERKTEGERILELLRNWENALPPSFIPIESPPLMEMLDDSILQHLQPLYFNSLNVAIAMAHHEALKINVFTLTHRGDEPRSDFFFSAVGKTLQICLGVQRMRQLGLFQISDGGDYGILWPLTIAAIWAPRGEIRQWILNLLNTWPREGMMDPLDIRVSLQSIWSRIDQGFGVEGVRNDDSFRAMMTTGKPVSIEIYERALDGDHQGCLRTGLFSFRFVADGVVEMTFMGEERSVVERAWHRGNMPLEHVAHVNQTPRVLPP